MRTPSAEVERDAASDGVRPRVAQVVFWLPVIGAPMVAVTFFHRPSFLWLVGEDGPIEWLQFVLFAGAGVLGGVAALRLGQRRDVAGTVLLGIGAIGLLGIAGEEISWGQRVLGLDTPDALAEINHQKETNLHNITTFPMQRIGNWLQLVLGTLGAVVPWLTRTSTPRISNRVLRLLSPPLFVTSGFALLAAYRFLRLFVVDSVAAGIVKFGEWPELTFALGLFVFAALTARNAGRAGHGEKHPRVRWVA